MYQYSLPDLSYSTDALEPHYSSEGLELHHEKHHAAYVKKANQAMTDLAAARKAKDFKYLPKLQKDLAFNLSGHRLHSLLWRSLSPQGGGKPPRGVDERLSQYFGGVDAFREQFTAAAMGIQGSGWAALCLEPASEGLVIEQIYDHQDNTITGSQPLLVLDMWEHAFYLQYRNEKAKWVEAFWEVVNWQHLAEAMKSASVATPAAA